MTHVFHRQLASPLPTAVGGDGIFVIDSEGNRYLDACGGAAVSCLGHSNEAVIEATIAQLRKLPYAHTGFFTSEPTEALGDYLISKAPPGIGWVYFLSGGSEAMEAALKMAREYFLIKGEPDRKRVIARRQSYHGNTLGALAVGGNAMRREAFRPLLIETSHISPCYAYRGQLDGESQEDYGLRVANELEAEIQRLGPETVMAFVAETVVGATAGAITAVPGYFKRLREICDQYGVLLILDEVMSGMGRTGRLFACEDEGISPDILTIAKGLGAGYQPIGATLVSGDIYNVFKSGPGAFQHGHTYMGHPTATAAGMAVQREIESRDLLSNVRAMGGRLETGLKKRFKANDHIGEVRGRGLFRAIELVRDADTKEPFDPGLKLNGRIKKAAMKRGLMCYPGGGTADGARGDHVLLAPPFIITETEVDMIVERLGNAVDAALAEIA